jgi:hypothetical protein
LNATFKSIRNLLQHAVRYNSEDACLAFLEITKAFLDLRRADEIHLTMLTDCLPELKELVDAGDWSWKVYAKWPSVALHPVTFEAIYFQYDKTGSDSLVANELDAMLALVSNAMPWITFKGGNRATAPLIS